MQNILNILDNIENEWNKRETGTDFLDGCRNGGIYALREAKERIQKELSTESNERYFVCFYSSISYRGRQASGGWGFVRNVFPNYSEILSLIKEKEGGAFIIIHSITEVYTKEDLLNFVNLPPHE